MRNKFLILALLPVLLTISCKKNTDNLSKVVKVSFPSIALNGQDVVIVAQGSNYTDAGAKLTDDITGAVTDIQPVSNNVNTAQPGIYVVSYSASNANGFEAAAARTVIVPSTVTGTPDRSGDYERVNPVSGFSAIITKVVNSVYKVQNPGGAGAGVDLVVYYLETAPNVFICPQQPTADGPFGVINIAFTATGASWNIVNAGYGTQQRFFEK